MVTGRRSRQQSGIRVDAYFTLNGVRDCGTLCQQVPFEVKLKDLDSPVWIDHDNDGYYNAPAGAATFVPGVRIDCNDDDASTHPGA
jgi:hypothetical protein